MTINLKKKKKDFISFAVAIDKDNKLFTINKMKSENTCEN